MKSKLISTLSYGFTIATIVMLFFKWFGFSDMSYFAIFSPLLILIAVLIAVLILSIIIGSIAYIFKKDKIGERKQKLKDLKE